MTAAMVSLAASLALLVAFFVFLLTVASQLEDEDEIAKVKIAVGLYALVAVVGGLCGASLVRVLWCAS